MGEITLAIEQLISDLDWCIDKASKEIDNGNQHSSKDFIFTAKSKLDYLMQHHPKNQLTEKYTREYNVLVSSHEDIFKTNLKELEIEEKNNSFNQVLYNTIGYMGVLEEMIPLGYKCASKTCLNIIGFNINSITKKFPRSTSIKGLSLRYLNMIKDYNTAFGENYYVK